jgi:hypothetical protein
MFSSDTILGQAIAGALGAALFATASYLFIVLSNGSVIHLLGGVTRREFTTTVHAEVASQIKSASSPNTQLKWHGEPGRVAAGTDTTYYATCQAGETIIGGYCELGTGAGYLVNAGLKPDGAYQCSWIKTQPGSFAALIFAACTNP